MTKPKNKEHVFDVSFAVDSANLGLALAALDPVDVLDLSIRLQAKPKAERLRELENELLTATGPDVAEVVALASERKTRGEVLALSREPTSDMPPVARGYMSAFSNVGEKRHRREIADAASVFLKRPIKSAQTKTIDTLVNRGYLINVGCGAYKCLKLPE